MSDEIRRQDGRRGRDAAIGIVGAGPAGLSVAEELRSRGYTDVTVLEARGEAGGKVYSVPPSGEHDGFELGTVWYIPGPVYDRYLQRYGVVTEGRRTPALRVLDRASRQTFHPFVRPDGVSHVSWLRSLWRLYRALRPLGAPSAPGFASAANRALAIPADAWFDANGLQAARLNLRLLPIALQFGHEERNVPTAYVLTGLSLLLRYSLREMLGLRYRQVPSGNQELWRRMGRAHDVLTKERVCEVRRGARIDVRTDSTNFVFDRLVWTADVTSFLHVADATEAEGDLFGRVRRMRRVVVVHRVEGLAESLFLVVRDGSAIHLPAGEPQILMSVPGAGKLYAFYAFLDEATTLASVDEKVADLVDRLGGRLGARYGEPAVWDWFPHFGSADVAAGIYDRFEALQGRRGVYFAGEIAAGVGVAFATEYAANLVARHFAAR